MGELFTAHRRAQMDAPLEEACTAAFRQARFQKIYFPGEQFSFYFRLGRHSNSGNVTTPYVHNVELALEHRKQLLGSLEGGRPIKKLKLRLKSTSNKAAWQNDMHGMQRQLLGYVSCELHNRKSLKTISDKRLRLRWKQPVPPSHESKMVLPWLTGLMGDKTKNKVAVQERLRTFLKSDGVTRLQHFLQEAVDTPTTPRLALEELPQASARNSAQKRKPDSIESVARAKAKKRHKGVTPEAACNSVGQEVVESQQT